MLKIDVGHEGYFGQLGQLRVTDFLLKEARIDVVESIQMPKG